MRVTQEVFIEEAKYFAGLLTSKKALFRYYTAYSGGAFGICSSVLKEILWAIEPDNFLPIIHKNLFDQLKLVKYEISPTELMLYIPNNATLSFPDGILGTRVKGNFSLSDLIVYDEISGFKINREEIIFRDLLEALITSPYNAFLKNKLFYSLVTKMQRNVIESSITKNLGMAYEALVIRRFLSLSKISNTDILNYLSSTVIWEPVESIIKGNLLVHKFVVEDESVVNNHLIDRARDKTRYNKILDILGSNTGGSSIFPRLLYTLRL